MNFKKYLVKYLLVAVIAVPFFVGTKFSEFPTDIAGTMAKVVPLALIWPVTVPFVIGSVAGHLEPFRPIGT